MTKLHTKLIGLIICLFTGSVFASRGHLSEFDRTIFQDIAKRAGISLKYESYSSNASWQKLLNDVKSGDFQVTGSATVIEHRKSWAKFTKPYRTEEVVVFLPKNVDAEFKSDLDFINYVKANPGIRVGVIEGWVQPTKALNDFVNDPANKDIFIKKSSDAKVGNLLVYGKVDCVLLERACRHDNPVEYYPEYKGVRIGAITPISFIMTKNGANSVSDADVAKINLVIDQMQNSGELTKRFEEYIND